ncbi:hypothetical protein HZU38_11575 [Mycolicibacterium vanbaalenii]|uniref:hypothetical protein n=1 Tax=Mycolicibacterium vanbaalenii TaxID=110539 RepID=UPI001F35E243|nr:hypothetical protein [Mycolicibacterium vanbaalenii]UJL30988.1 hypothetical protein HZU38_11575 [Mycolicibacterium vanbaalenii]
MHADEMRGEMTPRESILLRGLADWVALDRIHWDVSESKPGAPLIVIQEETLALIHDLVAEGLFEVGEVSDERGFSPWTEPLDEAVERIRRVSERGFSPWTEPLDEAVERIRRVYVTEFDKQNIWPWYCWLNLTDKGEQLAQEIQSTPPTD